MPYHFWQIMSLILSFRPSSICAVSAVLFYYPSLPQFSFAFVIRPLTNDITLVFTVLLNKSAINGFYWTLSSFLLRRDSSIRINSLHFYEIRQRQDPSRRFIESEIYILSTTFLDVSSLFVKPDSYAWNISLLFILYKIDETCVFLNYNRLSISLQRD